MLIMALVPLRIVTSLTHTISDQSLRVEVPNTLRAIADSDVGGLFLLTAHGSV
jgi:hypothetical protein